jgi:CRP/FNR family cyclic AMP-dependent transcriptional regulator
MINVIPILKRCEVFVGLDDADLQKIAQLQSWQRNSYRAGDYIFHQDTLANEFFILEDGEVNLLLTVEADTSSSAREIPVDNVTTGDVFGWSSLVAPHALTMSAICIKPSTVLTVSGADLIKFLDQNHTLGYEVMKGLVRVIGARFRDLRRRFATKDKANTPHRK